MSDMFVYRFFKIIFIFTEYGKINIWRPTWGKLDKIKPNNLKRLCKTTRGFFVNFNHILQINYKYLVHKTKKDTLLSRIKLFITSITINIILNSGAY